jgi:hypothetical protein
MSVALYALACFLKVFLAIFQSKNVQYTHYISAFLTSLLITFADVIYIRLAVSSHIMEAVLVGSIANAFAVVFAMKFYATLRGENHGM